MDQRRARTGSKKCAKRYIGDDDRISRLPDDILVDVLSFLPLKEAARTSVLSFRWTNLWKHSPCLKFDSPEALDKIAVDKTIRTGERRKYIKWVNYILRSLRLNKAVSLKEFKICFDLSKSARKEITQWLTYAFRRQVERLELDLSSEYLEGILSRSLGFVFPKEFLIHHPLLDFKTLKALSLISVNVTGEVIELFLRNCPALEQLVIHKSKETTDFELCGSSLVLKHLEICYCYYVKSIKISAPNLTSLKITTVRGLFLENVPKLVDVHVVTWWYGEIYIKNLLPALSCCLPQLEILTVLMGKPQESSDPFEYFPEMPKLKKLIIECAACSYESIIGLASLIRASPYLQEFVLTLCSYTVTTPGREVNIIRFPHHHLKVFKFTGYYGCGSDVEMMRYVLENCDVLEKVIVDGFLRPNAMLLPNPSELVAGETARNRARQLLEAEVPEHVELVIR